MTAAARRPRPVEIVADSSRDPADATPTTAFDDEWRPESAARQWEPESQLVGALMWMPAARATTILELVPDCAIEHPLTRWVYELIRALVDVGRDPHPVAVLIRAKHQPAADALHPGRPPTAAQHERVALHLADLYTHTVTPAAAASHARDVLDDAYRRAFREHGIRMQQLGETPCDRADLTEQFTLIRDQLADLWRRCETAAKPRRDRP